MKDSSSHGAVPYTEAPMVYGICRSAMVCTKEQQEAVSHKWMVVYSVLLEARWVVVGWVDGVGVLPPQVDPEAVHLQKHVTTLKPW